MREISYIFSNTKEYRELVDACTPIDNHDESPSRQILAFLISYLNNPGSILDRTLFVKLEEYIADSEHKNKIVNIAVSLYVYLYCELTAMNYHKADAYYLIDTYQYVHIGMIFNS